MSENNKSSNEKDILHILVIDDDPRLRRLLQRYLSENGFRISGAESAYEARQMLKFLQPDALVLDVTMPGEDGLQLTHSLREEGKDMPIILLTARGEPEDRIAGLEAGADDYLGKPFEPKELLLRLKIQFRRLTQPIAAENIRLIRLGNMEFDPVRNLLCDKNGIIHLTGGEIALLRVLATQPNEILSREEIVQKIGMEEIGERAVDVQVTRLRRRIETDPRQPQFLHTVRGKGYVLKPGY
ncbi:MULTISPECIES: response regulator transcription factor [unclassified Commensalibacter]|uniref:response regulator transcription factor n=1 Tax=unclassified Commensalibacter TaxID=2630218 RepID=UPI0018DB64EB|nr:MULTISPECIES: response regulator transcription factor [unclassified Commensalibacter]MBH9969987.1 response regulator transcription factor [Commensalibacter sp. M0265]MBH9977117.1 response regulator transcription factor [Commensalibacter sp. M0266]MBH9993022.1 response regulator transcription factor [Commensalibacter sp. M0270]MBI0046293.1 response regulator transcription factor [Commensalibacter sp. M0267]MBI0056187.1 response regulator transcription factor [Commensalibacter sp. M0268]